MLGIMGNKAYMLGATDQGARENNLNFLRLIAASLVTLSHAWPITGTNGEPLASATGLLSLGSLAVDIFFAISGFLIAKSFDRSRNLGHFLKARALRLYPGLLVALLLSVIAIQFLAGTLPNQQFFLNSSTYSYIKNNLLFNTQFDLPGIFLNNPFPGSVNGSLWTLRYEVAMYLAVTLAGLAGLLRRPHCFNGSSIPLVILLIAGSLSACKPFGDIPGHAIVMLLCFYLGTLMYVNRHYIMLDMRLALALWFIVWLSRNHPVFHPIYAITLSYSVLLLGFLPRLQLATLSLRNDYSYGIYIYSFPIQQLLAYFQPQFGPWANCSVSYLLVIPLAIASWHLIEKPALTLK